MMETDCPRCGVVPARNNEEGRLYVWPPLGHTRAKLVRTLAEAGWPVTSEGERGTVILDLPQGNRDALAEVLSLAVTRAEAHDSRALFVPAGRDPGIEDLGRVETLEAVIARAQGGWLLDLMRDGRIVTHFQPIVHATEPDRVFAHECLMRGQGDDGALVSPGAMFDVAERADLIFPLDRMARTTAVRNAAAHRVTGHIFINFTPAAVYDPGYCLRTTVQAVEEAGLERSRVVFEVIETERIGDPDHLANVLRFYREAGFKVALDDVGGGYSCLGLVARLKPDFIKLDRSLIDGVSGHPEQAAVVRHLFALARDLDIRTVAEGLERPEDLAWVREHGADFVQGFLTGRPAPEPVAAVLTRRFG